MTYFRFPNGYLITYNKDIDKIVEEFRKYSYERDPKASKRKELNHWEMLFYTEEGRKWWDSLSDADRQELLGDQT